MKIMSLNAAFGEQEPVLRNYLSSKLGEVAIYCLQESTCDVMKYIIDDLYPSDAFDIAKADKNVPPSRYGLHTIVASPLKISHSEVILDDEDPTVGQALASEIELEDGSPLTIVNVHGIPFPGEKLDNPDRLRQSDLIIEWLGHNATRSTVICGDFNLLPETESVKRFAAAGYHDLISENKIKTTRNEIAWAQWPDSKQYHADYTFTSGLTVNSFKAPYTLASDHLPMITDIQRLTS